jgi:hypothetical protein
MVVMQIPVVGRSSAWEGSRGGGLFGLGAAVFPRVRPVGVRQSSILSLDAEQMVAIDKPASNLLIEVRSGSVWLTQTGCMQDVVLRTGDAFTPQGDGKLIITAMETSAVKVAVLE